MTKKMIRTATIAGGLAFATSFAPAFGDVVSAQEEDTEEDGEDGDDSDDSDGEENTTPAPTAVNTGGEAPSDDDTLLLVSAGALASIAGGAFLMRRRTLA